MKLEKFKEKDNKKTFIVVFILPFVAVADTPGGILIGEQIGNAFLLFLAADVEKQFHQQISIVG